MLNGRRINWSFILNPMGTMLIVALAVMSEEFLMLIGIVQREKLVFHGLCAAFGWSVYALVWCLAVSLPGRFFPKKDKNDMD